MKIRVHQDAINRHQNERLIIVETAIHRVSCLNRTVLRAQQCCAPKTYLVQINENCCKTSTIIYRYRKRQFLFLLEVQNQHLQVIDRVLLGECVLRQFAQCAIASY